MRRWPSYEQPEPVKIAIVSRNEDLGTSKKRNPHIVRKRRKPKRMCRCGDPTKIRNLMENFAQSSTLHGAVFMGSKHGKTLICFWRTLFFVCFLSVVASVGSITYDAFTSPSVHVSSIRRKSTLGKQEHEDFPVYPGFTVCRQPSYETDDPFMKKLYEYAYVSLGYPFSVLSVKDRSLIMGDREKEEEKKKLDKKIAMAQKFYEMYKRKSSNFSLREFLISSRVKCESMFSECVADIYPINCCDNFKPVLTNYGTCFSFTPTDKFWRLNTVGEAIGSYSFFLDLFTPLPIESERARGFAVFFRDPFLQSQYVDHNFKILINPDSITQINVMLVMTNREDLYDTWFGLGAKCPKLDPHLEANEAHRERYNRNTCLMRHLMGNMEKDCNCVNVVNFEEGEESQKRVCEPFDIGHCFTNSFREENVSQLRGQCPEPCREYYYEHQLSLASFDKMEKSPQKSRIEIRYNSDEYIYNEYRRVTISTFFSQIGGAMGLLVGASIITSVELIAFLGKLIYYRFVPCGKQKVKIKRAH